MRLVGGERGERAWQHALAGALMVGGPVWQALYSAHYPFSRWEAVAIPLAAAAIGAAVALAGRAIGGLLGALVFAGLLFVFADTQLDLQRWLFTWLIAVICIGLTLLLAAHRAAIASLALGAFYIASLVREPIAPRPSQLAHARTATSAAPPLLVHIIVDEQWGPAGLRAAGDSATAAFLTDFYERRGFELHDAAYSRYQYTMESIPTALSMGEPVRFNPPPQTKPYWRSMRENPYFARLRALGYDVHVVQSTYLDFCQSRVPVVSCAVESGDAIRNIAFLDGSGAARARWLVRYFLNTRSHLYKKLHPDAEVWRRSVAGGGIEAGHELATMISARPGPGQAIFAHLLLPHRPVDVDADCRILAGATDRLYADWPDRPSDGAWHETLQLTAGQIRCAHRILDRVIAAIDSTVGRDGAIVIIHGDHGSRVLPHKPTREALSAYTPAELDQIFPTLLAIRRPHVPAAVYHAPVPMQDALWSLARNGFAGPMPTTWEHALRRMEDAKGDTLRRLSAGEMVWVR